MCFLYATTAERESVAKARCQPPKCREVRRFVSKAKLLGQRWSIQNIFPKGAVFSQLKVLKEKWLVTSLPCNPVLGGGSVESANVWLVAGHPQNKILKRGRGRIKYCQLDQALHTPAMVSGSP